MFSKLDDIYNSPMSVKEIPLPKYNLAQELWNSISHGLGSVLTLIFGPFLLIKAAQTGDPWKIVSCSIYVFTLLLLFTCSCLYHALARNNGKRVFRVIDHNMVYALIMGTYAPYCLVALNSYNPWLCWIIFGSVLVGGILGIVFNSIDIHKYRRFCMIAYLLMGWAIVGSMYPLCEAMGGFFPGPCLLLIGGLLFTIGAIFYGIGGRKNPWMHTVFHFFVLAGAMAMFASVYFYVI